MRYRVWTFLEGVDIRPPIPSETGEPEVVEGLIPAIDRVMELLKPGGITSEEDVIRVKAIVLEGLSAREGQGSYHTGYRTVTKGHPRMMHVLAEAVIPGRKHPVTGEVDA